MSDVMIRGELHARTAVHIGSGAASDLTDAPLRRDAQGNLILPGSAIAGSLRTLLTRLAPSLGYAPCRALQDPQDKQELAAPRTERGCTCPVCHLLGDMNPNDATGSQSSASRLIVHHASLAGGASATRIRDGVGIDRVTGAAARHAGARFDLEVLPPGTVFSLRLELEDAEATDSALLAAALAEWQAGRAALGGRIARGLGAFTLQKIEARKLALDGIDSLIACLASDDPWEVAAPLEEWLAQGLRAVRVTAGQGGPPPQAPRNAPRDALRNWICIEGALLGQGPLLTNDSAEAAAHGFDHAPLLVQMGDLSQPVLTGAGLRGVLRSHAERIARTLATHAAAGRDAFLAACPACDPLQNDPAAPLASCDSLLPRGGGLQEQETQPEDLCLACRLFGSTRRGSRLLVEDAPYDQEAAGGAPVYKMLDFLAIDRFTGGGAEHLKFDALALWKPAFRLRLRLENPAESELGWLLLLLRDLAEGWLHVGYGAAKGFGRVKLGEWKLRLGYLDDAGALGLAAPSWKPGASIFAEQEWTFAAGQWPDPAGAWVAAFTQQATTFRRGARLPALKEDSYFNAAPESPYSIDRIYAQQAQEGKP